MIPPPRRSRVTVTFRGVTVEAADGSPAGEVRGPYLGLDDWGAGGHTYRSHLGAGAGDGPWTVELAIEVTPLDA